jgi:hypothetical protein
MPTFKAYKNGEVIGEFAGAVPAKLTVSFASCPSLPQSALSGVYSRSRNRLSYDFG